MAGSRTLKDIRNGSNQEHTRYALSGGIMAIVPMARAVVNGTVTINNPSAVVVGLEHERVVRNGKTILAHADVLADERYSSRVHGQEKRNNCISMLLGSCGGFPI